MNQPKVVNYWLVVDTIRIPDAIDVLTRNMAVQQAIVLFAGSDFDYLNDQSPLVVNLGSDKTALDKWLTLPYFDSSSVIFELDASQDGSAFSEHLQSLLQVKIDNKACFLRFYTNVFWNQAASQLNDIDIATLLGSAQAIHWVNHARQRQTLHHSPIQPEQSQPLTLTSPIFKQWV
ncbi:DUF4123 domain-containing protein [Vibrio aestuarianus]|uniref:DUF4123 domain-containing protein n=1 Tax=Vibrio aestuarianus TaxID=28171 RepID=A0A9X4ESC0_9VIBR|nr:DUF4123 domain-containing protein [Vibrio aestuarianus]MDE1222122.1 DUF4123 domain-containing protein [Vibrio aestuarianus]MDE1241381.1 DUF4123 domain-containing protein [Vibrio aestuarianus]WGK83544.1 DUF4123 domain-containing protein [Vibrio aestuarianus]